MKLDEIANAISAHLRRFEADKGEGGVNWWNKGKVNGTRPYYYPGAHRAGSYVGVTYVTYQGTSNLTKAEAEKYLAWLDAGNVGCHFEALREKS